MKLIHLSAVAAIGMLAGCSTVPEKVDGAGVVDKPFPKVTGKGLDGKAWTLPDDLAGKPALLLIGYKQASQFDIDRWMLALGQLGTPVDVYEVPTIRGLMPGLFAKQIDDGMRRGIPEELWKAVITVYGDAGAIEEFTGKANPMPARVVLLNKEGRVAWFHDRGFGPHLAQELDRRVRSLD